MIVPCAACERPNRVPAARLAHDARCAACKAPLLPLARPLPLGSKADLDELIAGSPLPVLIDFWAPWCGPCRQVAPEFDRLARERVGAVIIAKVDTEQLPDLAQRFGIQAIPTMVLFRGGREALRESGAMSAAAIAERFALPSPTPRA
jgi:thioredoxin 2